MEKRIRIEVISDERVGEGGFLHLRRVRLRNHRPDGSHSREYLCDFVERPGGIDAVVLAIWRRGGDGRAVEVLLRDGLRPALALGRPADRVPLPDARERLFVTELVAGVIERGEVGEAAVRARAADEAWEEAGLRIAPEAIELLGGSFPSPGMTAEKFWFAAVEAPGAEPAPLEGDGSPMEEGATVCWLPLDEAIARCSRGEIEDAKTELLLRRLKDRLAV